MTKADKIYREKAKRARERADAAVADREATRSDELAQGRESLRAAVPAVLKLLERTDYPFGGAITVSKQGRFRRSGTVEVAAWVLYRSSRPYFDSTKGVCHYLASDGRFIVGGGSSGSYVDLEDCPGEVVSAMRTGLRKLEQRLTERAADS